MLDLVQFVSDLVRHFHDTWHCFGGCILCHELKVRVRRHLSLDRQSREPVSLSLLADGLGALRMIQSLFQLFSALLLASRLTSARGFLLEQIEKEEGEEWNYRDKVGGDHKKDKREKGGKDGGPPVFNFML